jgi:hypothetical protein
MMGHIHHLNHQTKIQLLLEIQSTTIQSRLLIGRGRRGILEIICRENLKR